MSIKSPIFVVPDALVQKVNDFVLVLVLASVAALLTFLGAPAAERSDVPDRIVSAAIGVGSTLALKTSLLLALGTANFTEPLGFVTIETAR